MNEIELLRTENKELEKIIKKQEERERRLYQKNRFFRKTTFGVYSKQQKIKKED